MADTKYPPREELVNALTHAVGALLSLGAGATLTTMAAQTGDPWRIIGAAVFGVALVLLYTASAVYHGAPGGLAKGRLEILDHCMIFVLIAGTYTPFTLVSLRGPWGWSLFAVVWGLAVAGISLKLIFGTRFPLLSTAIYIAMGWIVLIAIVPMVQALSATTLTWLVAGGLAYTAGTVFYHNRRIPYAHAIWHLFVIAGSVCHAIAVGAVVA